MEGQRYVCQLAGYRGFCFLNFLATPRDMWHLSSPTGTEPVSPALEARSLNHWTAREGPVLTQ